MNLLTKPKLIVITGPTASGKTRLAACVAAQCNGEIISADSRQVYRGMDQGTGKDLHDFMVGEYMVPYHLIDIVEPGYEYNVYEFQRNFANAFNHIVKRKKMPILCGGTGLYIEAVLRAYPLQKVKPDPALRQNLQKMTNDELEATLKQFRRLHNTTDTSHRDRLIRAIEIEIYQQNNHDNQDAFPEFTPLIFGVHFERQEIRMRITERLERRLETGMIEEIQRLLKDNLSPEQLKFYGLEYKIITRYVIGEITYDEMFRSLNTSIHQFAKRQMTWFRRMERNGLPINWIDGRLSMEEKATLILEKL
ncbi:MAG TPA: tRNA (adenosine(37)-N6)-dimethylallyltransferase MiaA [Bacteroidales bacterium]|nr:tRNA (adenosine(37)-N6)-dimethylallyltransferase MiaA [Bacteroidales bacterium]